ncbi:MAG: hypothetical protein M1571_05680 [Firmicutes bacterium]|nr:hypothetical protein [Bacillota bacterium]
MLYPISAERVHNVKRSGCTHAPKYSLKSDNEKKRVVSALHEAVNGFKEPVQVFSIGRPIDLGRYIRHIGEKTAAETNTVRKLPAVYSS